MLRGIRQMVLVALFGALHIRTQAKACTTNM